MRRSRASQNFFSAMWFTITTMTTVGYGDYVPTSAPGRAIASIACVLGIILLALVVTLITDFLSLNGLEARAVRRVQGSLVRRAEGRAAAELIQHVWRHTRGSKQQVAQASKASRLGLLHTLGKQRRQREMVSIETDDEVQSRIASLENVVLSRLAALEVTQARILERLDAMAAASRPSAKCI